MHVMSRRGCAPQVTACEANFRALISTAAPFLYSTVRRLLLPAIPDPEPIWGPESADLISTHYDAFGVVGTALSKKSNVFQRSSL